MPKEFITSGYLDVKISTKVKRGFTPWKAWRKQWCEIKRVDDITDGVEIKLKNSADSNSSNCLLIPRNAMLCRTESRSKHFSFGIFGTDRCHKPLLFLSGVTESDSQIWMASIRKLLSFATHFVVPEGSFYISMVDNTHSRSAGMTGLHGMLSTNAYEVIVKDACTGEVRTTLQWYQLLQFHLAATGSLEDEKRICIIHTSKEFRAGAGQLHFFCLQAPQLLECLVARGKIPKIYVNSSFMSNRRFSRSEGDLRDENCSNAPTDSPTSPVCFRSHSGSEDSGVRVSMASDDSNLVLKCKKAASLISIGLALLVATPGGSEIDAESMDGLLENEEELFFSTSPVPRTLSIEEPRRESGVSVFSGVYEEIPDRQPSPRQDKETQTQLVHHYEDPVDVILTSTNKFTPPPLPPRQDNMRHDSCSDGSVDACSTYTPTTKCQLRSFSLLTDSSTETVETNMTPESEYMVMTPARADSESIYEPMLPDLRVTLEENTYMVMTGKRKK